MVEPNTNPSYIAHNFLWMPRNPEDCGCDECQDLLMRERQIERSETLTTVTATTRTGVLVYCSKCRVQIPDVDSFVEVKVPDTICWSDGNPFPGYRRYTLHPDCVDFLENQLPDHLYQQLSDQIAKGTSQKGPSKASKAKKSPNPSRTKRR